MTTNDIELRKKQEEIAIQLAADYDQDLGGGFENQSAADQSIPFLGILQDGSPQVKARDPKYIPGARAGMMINSVTSELYDPDEGLIVIPCLTEHCYVEWVPRNQGGGGGGFVARHAVESDVVSKAKAEARARGGDMFDLKVGTNDLIETYYLYALIQKPKFDLRQGYPSTLDELIDLNEIGQPVVIPFTSTKIKHYKNINTTINMFKLPGLPHPQNQPPLWAFPLWFRTVLEKRPAGESFNFNIRFAPGPQITPQLLLPRWRDKAAGVEWPLYTAARELRKVISGGSAKIDYNQQGGGSERAQSGGGSGPATEDDIPF